MKGETQVSWEEKQMNTSTFSRKGLLLIAVLAALTASLTGAFAQVEQQATAKPGVSGRLLSLTA